MMFHNSQAYDLVWQNIGPLQGSPHMSMLMLVISAITSLAHQ